MAGAAKRSQSANSIGHNAFDQLMKDRRAAPRMAPWNLEAVAPSNSKGTSWSATLSSREKQIVDALCGVETSPLAGGAVRTLPGYGTLMEARKRRQQEGDKAV
jgi:hypothetical protein